MRISIVTPSLNQCGFIPEMLASLGSQDYPDWEHVVFDAGSTDGSVEAWREWEEGGKLRNGETKKWGNGEIETLRNREAGELRNWEIEKWGNGEMGKWGKTGAGICGTRSGAERCDQ